MGEKTPAGESGAQRPSVTLVLPTSPASMQQSSPSSRISPISPGAQSCPDPLPPAIFDDEDDLDTRVVKVPFGFALGLGRSGSKETRSDRSGSKETLLSYADSSDRAGTEAWSASGRSSKETLRSNSPEASLERSHTGSTEVLSQPCWGSETAGKVSPDRAASGIRS